MGKHKLGALNTLLLWSDVAQAQQPVQVLSTAGYDVKHSVASADDEVYSALDERNWDIVLCDGDLPLLGSKDTSAALFSAVNGTPFVLFTRQGQGEIVINALDHGISNFVMKDNLESLARVAYQEILQKDTSEDLCLLVDRYKEIIDLSSDAIIALDSSWMVTLFSKGAQDMFGYSPYEVLGKPFSSLMQHDTGKMEENTVPPDTVGFQLIKRRDASIVCKDGTVAPVEIHMSRSVIKDESRIYTVILRDIADRKAREQELEWLANHDPLTEIHNRRAFHGFLDEEIKRAKRDDMQFGLLYLDIDNFKQINDEYGHDIGDAVLKRFAAKIRDGVREVDIVARLSGDEFAVILHNIKGPQSAAHVAEKIISFFEKPFVFDGNEITSLTSIGIAIYPADATSNDQLLKCADNALYKVKQAGKSKHQFYAHDCS